MPYNNGFGIDINGVYLCDSNGAVLGKMENIEDFQAGICEPCGNENAVWSNGIDFEKEYTCSFGVSSSRAWNCLNRILLGWKAKGPIRRRLIYKLLKARKNNAV